MRGTFLSEDRWLGREGRSLDIGARLERRLSDTSVHRRRSRRGKKQYTTIKTLHHIAKPMTKSRFLSFIEVAILRDP